MALQGRVLLVPWHPSQKWLREAEIKHGRICMLAFTGFVVADLCPLPGVTLSSVAAHDANLGEYGGAMGQIFWVRTRASFRLASHPAACGRMIATHSCLAGVPSPHVHSGLAWSRSWVASRRSTTP